MIKRITFISIVFLLVTSQIVVASPESASSEENILHGMAQTNLTDTGLVTNNSQNIKSELVISVFNIINDDVYIEGALSYGPNEYKIIKKGKILIDKNDDHKFYIDFNEDLNTDDIIVANSTIKNGIISFVLFNKESNDLIKIESSTSVSMDFNNKTIFSEASPGYEYYEPKIFKPVDFEFKESDVKMEIGPLSHHTGSRTVEAWVEYSNNTRHYIIYSIGLDAPIAIVGDGNINSSLRVEDKFIADSNGNILVNDHSDLQLGHQFMPGTVTAHFTLTNSSNTVRDYIREMFWQYNSSGSSLSTQENNVTNLKKIQAIIRIGSAAGNFIKQLTRDVYEGPNWTRIYYPQDGGYPYNIQSPYPTNTVLYKIGSQIIESYNVGKSETSGNGAQKGARIRYNVPLYTAQGTFHYNIDSHVEVNYNPE